MAVRIWSNRVDANQAGIVRDLRELGFSVEPGHDDLLVGKDGLTLWVEVKNPKGLNKMRPKQEKLLQDWQGAYIVAHCTDDVVAWFDSKGGKHGPG